MMVEGTWASYDSPVALLCTRHPSVSSCSEALTCIADNNTMAKINSFFITLLTSHFLHLTSPFPFSGIGLARTYTDFFFPFKSVFVRCQMVNDTDFFFFPFKSVLVRCPMVNDTDFFMSAIV